MNVSEKDLNEAIERLNRLTHSPTERLEIGHYYLSRDSCGYSLLRVENRGGGVSTPLGDYRFTKRVLWFVLKAYMKGLEDTNKFNQ